MERFIEALQNVKAEFERQTPPQIGLVCRVGFAQGCPVLKLQKPSWTNDPMEDATNQTGIFFSVWLTDEGLAKNRAYYNIHALKLRQLRGYSIASRDFAAEFRSEFAPQQDLWPNVRTNYGPRTPMQGWIEIEPGSFEQDVLRLTIRFAEMAETIDALLADRRTK